MKNGTSASTAVDEVYTEFLKFGCPRKEKWFALFFSDILAQIIGWLKSKPNRFRSWWKNVGLARDAKFLQYVDSLERSSVQCWIYSSWNDLCWVAERGMSLFISVVKCNDIWYLGKAIIVYVEQRWWSPYWCFAWYWCINILIGNREIKYYDYDIYISIFFALLNSLYFYKKKSCKFLVLFWLYSQILFSFLIAFITILMLFCGGNIMQIKYSTVYNTTQHKYLNFEARGYKDS